MEPLPEGEERTIAVSYVRLANRLSQMTPEEMFQEIQELAEAIDPESKNVDADARALAEMLTEARNRAAASRADGWYPATALKGRGLSTGRLGFSGHRSSWAQFRRPHFRN